MELFKEAAREISKKLIEDWPEHGKKPIKYVTPAIISLPGITGLASSNGLLRFGSLPKGNDFTVGKDPL